MSARGRVTAGLAISAFAVVIGTVVIAALVITDHLNIQSPAAGKPPAATSPNSTTSTTTSKKPDALAACTKLIGGGGKDSLLFERATGTLDRHLSPEMDAADAQALADISDEIEEIINVSPAEMAAHLRSFQLPFRQAADALASGGGSITLDTGAVPDGIVPLTEICVRAGYRIPTPGP